MSISKSYNKQNGVTYVYEVIENYWDKEKKQSRSKRKLIGKIDPATGEMVPTSSRGRPRKSEDSENYKVLYEIAQKELTAKDKRIAELEDMIRDYLKDEGKVLDETESSLKQRRIKTESLLHKLG
jgi:cysteinyl-tRNA synthetase